MSFTRRKALAIGTLAVMTAIALWAGNAKAQEVAAPAHLDWALSLVNTIKANDHSYGSPTEIKWKGVDGALSKNRSVCATFVTTLLKRAYGYTNTQLSAWTGSTSPSAELYHDLVAAQNGFQRITLLPAVQKGDLIAIDYRDGSASTGHMAIVSALPVDRGVQTVGGLSLRVYDVKVVDCSKSYRGKSDTRFLKPDLGSVPDQGAGQGIMRLYAIPTSGQLAGHAWSDSNGSTYYPNLTSGGRHTEIGRLIR